MPTMNELARSMMRCSWALTVLGVGRVAKAATGGEASRADARDTFDDLAATVESRLDEAGRNLYRTGDRLQDGVVGLLDRVGRLGHFGHFGHFGQWLGRGPGS